MVVAFYRWRLRPSSRWRKSYVRDEHQPDTAEAAVRFESVESAEATERIKELRASGFVLSYEKV